MSDGGLQLFGKALKAFRRGSYQFPSVWSGAVICGNTTQRNFALDEAGILLGHGSMKFKLSQLSKTITTERNTQLFFVPVDFCRERLSGQYVTHMILLCGVGEDTKSFLKSRFRHPDLDPAQLIWQEATL